MTNLSSAKKEVVVFPENSSSIIFEILEEFELSESKENAFEKIKNGKSSNGGLLAEVIKKIAYKEISAENVSLFLKENFNLPAEKIKKLELDIEEKILSKIKKILSVDSEEIKTEDSSLEKTKRPLSAKKNVPGKADTYREPIE